MKSAVIYVSVHHGNTRKIAEVMAQELSADLYGLSKDTDIDLTQYDLVGLASGVFYHGLHEKMKRFIAEVAFVPGQKVFLADTCGIAYRDYTKAAKKELAAKGADCIGSFQCRGFDTFGPFAKIGGIAKDHPNEKDLERARAFAAAAAKKVV